MRNYRELWLGSFVCSLYSCHHNLSCIFMGCLFFFGGLECLSRVLADTWGWLSPPASHISAFSIHGLCSPNLVLSCWKCIMFLAFRKQVVVGFSFIDHGNCFWCLGILHFKLISRPNSYLYCKVVLPGLLSQFHFWPPLWLDYWFGLKRLATKSLATP